MWDGEKGFHSFLQFGYKIERHGYSFYATIIAENYISARLGANGWADAKIVIGRRRAMKKISAVAAAFFLCIGTLTGCQETPDEVLVTPKEQKGNSYEEGMENFTEKIVDRLGIQDTYSAEFQTPDQVVFFTADHVPVNYPDVTNIPIYQVSRKVFDQELIDRITGALFGDAPIYFKTDYETRTKSELMKEIEYLKECVAKGNLDPYSLDHGEGSSKRFDIYTYIEELEEAYQNAPESYTHKTVKPSPDFDPETSGYEISEDWNWKEYYAVVDEEHVYSYQIDNCSEDSAEWKIKVVRDRFRDTGSQDVFWRSCFTEILSNPEEEWYNADLDTYGITDLEEASGIFQDEALKQADALVEKMGIEGMTVNHIDPALLISGVSNGTEQCMDAGYEFHYTRTLNGVPTLYTMEDNTSTDEDSTISPCPYEAIAIVVSGDGIETVELTNIYEIGEVRQTNPVLLTYDEILKKYENTVLVQYAKIPDELDLDYKRYFTVGEIVLSYMRITEAGTGNYLLVPVWDFLGRDWDTSYSTGYRGDDGEMKTACGMVWQPETLLTINAVDGTILNRCNGY